MKKLFLCSVIGFIAITGNIAMAQSTAYALPGFICQGCVRQTGVHYVPVAPSYSVQSLPIVVAPSYRAQFIQPFMAPSYSGGGFFEYGGPSYIGSAGIAPSYNNGGRWLR